MRSEHAEQALVVYLVNEMRPDLGEMMYAVPNGDLRHPKVAVKLKAEGVKAGVPDLVLAIPRGPYHGLYIEMKRIKGGRVSRDQVEWHERLRAQGYRVDVCYGHLEALAVIYGYDLL